MRKTTKVFNQGNSQAVRIPKEFRFTVSEVEIEKSGDAVILRPKRRDRWANLKRALQMFEGIEIERNQPTKPDSRNWPESW
jgi:antitoxin VapB